MKIVYDDIIFELQRAGGISKYWGKLIEKFSQNNELELINIRGKKAYENVFFSVGDEKNTIMEDLLPLKIKRYLPIFRLKEYDIFHSSYYRVPLFTSKRMKQVVTVHDFMYEFFDSGIKKKIHIWQKRKAMLRADAIICVSEHTKKDLIHLYPEINPEILHVVPNGVDKEFKKLENFDKEIKVDNVVLSSNGYLLYVGNRVGCKNFEFVLKLMSNSQFIIGKNFQLLCVGGGEFSNIEKEMIEMYNLHNVVHQVLYIENEKLNDLYNGAYALLFPSKYEGFGIPALEAQMAGCPVVYARTSSLPEVMGYKELGYELDNIIEASQRLESLEDEKIRKKIIDNGIVYASKLSWENSINLTHNVYKKVLEHG